MMLERNQTLIGAAVIAVVGVGTAFAVGATAGMFEAGEPMSAEFTDAAGLEPGDFVYVGGHRAGTVTGVEVEGEKVVVDFTLTAPQMPADSMAEIRLDTALGRRGLTVVPGTSTSTLEAGSVIPVDRSATPVDLPELGDESAELLGELDVEAMQELTTALADVTEDAHDDVAELLEGVESVSRIVSERRGELQAILDRAHTLVDATASKDEELVRIIDDFGSVLDRLVARRGDITRLLQETAATSTLTADLVEERREQIDRTLASFHEDLQTLDRHQVDFAHTLAYLGQTQIGFSSIGVSHGDAQVDNPYWGNVFTQGLGQVGVAALLDCGSPLDRMFTDLLGPDPRCENIEGPPAQGPEEGPPAEDDAAEPSIEPEVPDLPPRVRSGADALGGFLGGASLGGDA
jgi:phospholipid/cholesterol/gamma-HCH transport system substrate-binding protein